MADLGEDGADVTTGSVLRFRGDVEVQPGSNLTTLASGASKIALHDDGVDKGDIHTLDVLDGNSISMHASVTSNVGSLVANLARNRKKFVPDTGTIVTTDWNDYDVIYFSGTSQVAEIQTIPVPLDQDGVITGKELLLVGGGLVTEITLRYNTGSPVTARLFTPNLADISLFKAECVLLSYIDTRWYVIARNGVVVDSNGSGSTILGQSLDFRASTGLIASHSLVARVARVTYSLAPIADDFALRNISGISAAPTAAALSSWVDGTSLEYNAAGHAWRIASGAAGNGLIGGSGTPLAVGAGTKINVAADTVSWAGMEGRFNGADAGDFVGIDFTNSSGNVIFTLTAGAGGCVGVVANVNLSGVTYTAGDGIDLTGQVFSADVSDFAGAGLEDDGSNNLRIAAAAAGAGLTGGSGSALAVGAGTGITVAADTVSLANMSQARLKGRGIASGTGAPEDLTGSSVGAFIRKSNFSDLPLADGSHNNQTLEQEDSWIETDPSGTVTITGGAFEDGNAGHWFVYTKVGNSGALVFPDEDTGSTAVNRWSIPEQETLRLTHRTERALWGHDGTFHRLLGGAFYPFFNTTSCVNREIPIHNGTEWRREDFATAAAPLNYNWTGEHSFGSSIALTSIYSDSPSADIDDVDIGDVTIVRLNPSATIDLSGMIPAKDGHLVRIVNASNTNLIGITNDDVNSSANNRFALRVTTLFIQARAMVEAWYDGTTNRWRTDL